VVAVIVPAYRAAATLGRAVRSLLSQSLSHWQAVIVADDGGDYRALLAAEGLADSRLVFASTGRVGAGPSAARNVGLAATTAPLIAPLDADDRFAPERLARLVPLARVHGAAADNVAVVSDADDWPFGTLFSREGPEPRFLSVSAFLETSVPMFPVCRREVAGCWDEDLRFAEDVAFTLRVLDRLGTIPVCLEPLYQYRVRPGSLSAGADSALAADRAYAVLLAGLERGGLGFEDAARRRSVRAGLEQKRALNQAFAASGCATFQEFLAGRGALCPSPPSPGA
jgi:glycosyltransferase involved in cell wall biosynthesis